MTHIDNSPEPDDMDREILAREAARILHSVVADAGTGRLLSAAGLAPTLAAAANDLAATIRGTARVLRALRDEHGPDSVQYLSARVAASAVGSHWLIEYPEGTIDYRLALHLIDLVVDGVEPVTQLWDDDEEEDGE